MINAAFSESMVSILKSFIGCYFDSYEYAPIGNGTYGNVRIQINGEPYEIQNQQSVVLMNGESTDLSTFSIKKATGKFEPIGGDQTSVNVIEDTVKDLKHEVIQNTGQLVAQTDVTHLLVIWIDNPC